MNLPVESSFDQILSQLTFANSSNLPRKTLFWGEGAGEISSYIAGWMVGEGIDVIILDGANRFDPYMVSTFAKKASISPEDLLKRIWIARAFTCYQMTALVEEKLISLLKKEEGAAPFFSPRVILLGPVTPFLDEDVPEREVRPLFERLLRKVEEITRGGVPFFFFQPNPPSPSFMKVGTTLRHTQGREHCRTAQSRGGLGGFIDSKRVYLARRLLQISDLVWKISLEEEGPKMILEKEQTVNIIENCKLQNGKCKFEGKNLKCLSVGG